MSLGNRTVTFVKVGKADQPGYLGVTDRKDRPRSPFPPVRGCHLRPMSATESDSTHVETGMWKLTAPPAAAALAMNAPDEFVADGVTYLVEGAAMPKYDTDGTVDHVTIIGKLQEG
ncbi:hypothetical protein [Mycolicibacter algericus]|uniref:Head-to-tail stopper n=2 Tax=Mycolicibacter algericus TaxID=1288388 RepID=A0A7I9Y3Z3_MYCAL|nr:hypothetical protein [Mycolicibacter algericus]OQZ96918.1 hypothetical protein BST10_10095 [Mycolicibacter algericus DSM 45454]GFG83386.1 hypothetical protein MALGJ_00620 [Mycolicibacter algericus]